jgi:hypothetical protein
MRNVSKRSKVIKNIIGILIFLVIVYYGILPFLIGPKKMKAFCEQITPGIPSSEVYRLVEQTRYIVKENKTPVMHTIWVVDGRAMGRFTCDITLDQNAVVEAIYRHND